MTRILFVYPLAVVVFGLCLAAAVQDLPPPGIPQSAGSGLGWYFLAMGVFCPVSLLLARATVVALRERRQALFAPRTR